MKNKNDKDPIFPISFLDAIPIGLCLLDHDFNIIYWNSLLSHWSQIPQDDIIGENFFSYFPHLKEEKYKARFDSVFSGAPSAIFSSTIHKHLIPCPLPDGTDRTQQCIFSRLKIEKEGKTVGLLSIQDLTALSKKVRSYQDLNKQRNVLLASCSHDFRTPINAILGLLEIIKDEKEFNEEVRSYLDLIRDSANLLLDTAQDIITVTKFNTGKTSSKEKLDLLDLFEKTLQSFQTIAKKKDISLEFERKSGKAPIIGCESELQRVFNNILSNANKFTNRGGKIKASYELNPREISLSITDSGIGISKEKIPLLFEQFSEISRPGTEGEAGTGLGMFIIHKTITDHRGKIYVESEENVGTSFTLTLPLI